MHKNQTAAPRRASQEAPSSPAGSMRLDIPRKGGPGLGALCRDLVESGADDQPAEVWMDGVHCLSVRSIHAAALTTVAEEPYVRRVPYTPHPRAEIGPRMLALLARRDALRLEREIDRRLRKEYGA